MLKLDNVNDSYKYLQPVETFKQKRHSESNQKSVGISQYPRLFSINSTDLLFEKARVSSQIPIKGYCIKKYSKIFTVA